MNAAPESQLRLLELQGLDSKLAQLDHLRTTNPTLEKVAELQRQLADVNRAIGISKVAATDINKEVTSAEDEVERSRTRAFKLQTTLSSCGTSARDTAVLSDEYDALRAWIGTLEETQLEAMERLEAHQSSLDELSASQAQLEAAVKLAQSQCENELGDIDKQIAELKAIRAPLADEINPDLLKVYNNLRTRLGGVGAAELRAGVCSGCGLAVPPAELAALASAPADQVVRCEECGRIMVRRDNVA